MLNEGLFFVVSAPAGTGKTTLVNRLEAEFDSVCKSISYTTRKKRDEEVEARDYFFVDPKRFEEMIKKGDFLEYVKIFGNYYGTSSSFIDKKIEEKRDIFLVIDTEGAEKIRSKIDAIFIFISPPDLKELKRRLENRGSGEDIKVRLALAKKELKLSKKYDYLIVNDDLDKAYETLRSILIAEKHRIKRG